MSSHITPQQHIISLFNQKPCWMIKPLASKLGYSVISTRRFLADIGYYSSFTHNGKWYTLRSIPQFNQDGLWFIDEIGFSRAGSLINTIINLTIKSTAGMTAEQLGGKLHCRCHSILVRLFRQNKLKRQKVGRSHVYLSVDPAVSSVQQQVRRKKNTFTKHLPAEVAVFILVEFILQPDLNFEQLAEVVTRRRSITVEAPQVEALFALHDLKKTM